MAQLQSHLIPPETHDSAEIDEPNTAIGRAQLGESPASGFDCRSVSTNAKACETRHTFSRFLGRQFMRETSDSAMSPRSLQLLPKAICRRGPIAHRLDEPELWRISRQLDLRGPNSQKKRARPTWPGS